MKLYNFYVKHGVIYFLLLFIFAGTASAITSFLFPTSDIADFISLVILVCIVSLPLIVPISKTTQLMKTKCDPVGFIRNCDIILNGVNIEKKLCTLTYRQEITGLLLNKSAALIELDRYDEAIEIYSLCQKFVPKMLNSHMIIIHHNMAQICADREDFEHAEFYAEQEKNCIQKANGFSTLVLGGKMYFDLLPISTDAFIAFKKGDFEKAEKLYMQAEAMLTKNRQEFFHTRVALTYEIAQVKYSAKKYGEAAERFYYVSQNGGTTYYKTKAEEYLKRISENNAN